MAKNRLARENQVVQTMITVYCRKKHHQKTLCPECDQLLKYAKERIDHCPEGDEKRFCSNCAIHCYNPQMSERIRAVMRFSGPRMLLYHPIMAIRHLAASHLSR